MPLLTCLECRHQVSSDASACPNCGVTINPPQRRQIVEEERAERRRAEMAGAEVRRQEEERIRQKALEAEEITQKVEARTNRERKVRAAVFVALIIGTMIALLVTWLG